MEKMDERELHRVNQLLGKRLLVGAQVCASEGASPAARQYDESCANSGESYCIECDVEGLGKGAI